jgi:lactoylglutathione lyase
MKKFFFSILFCVLCIFCKAQSPQKPVLNHLAIYVVDLKISANFYMNVIGLDTIPEPFHDGKHVWLKTGPGNALHIIQGAEKKKEYYKNNHICFSIQSVDAFAETLKKRGIVFEDGPGSKNNKINVRPDGIKQIWLQDPDNYWIEVNDAKE